MKIVAGFAIMICFTVAANLLMKSGAMIPPAQRAVFGLLSWQTAFGIAMFGCAGLLYAWILQWLPLNVAQSFATAQFIAVIVASAVLLDERISMARWAGILLIAIGIVLVGLTYDSTGGVNATTARHGQAD